MNCSENRAELAASISAQCQKDEPPSAVLAAAHAKPFRTIEEIRAQVDETSEPYYLFDDLCRRFLDDDSDSTKVLFPFVREASLFGVPRAHDRVQIWFAGAFYAGLEFGRALPDQARAILTDKDVSDSFRRLGIIMNRLGTHEPSPVNIRHVFELIRQEYWGDGQIDDVLVDGLPKTLKAGVAMATVATFEPSLVDFVDRLVADFSRRGLDLFTRHMHQALVAAFGKPVHRSLRHPLLRMAETHYPAQEVSRSTLQGFLHEALRELKVRSETECPGSDADIETWVGMAVRFGTRLVEEHRSNALRAFREIYFAGRVEEKLDAKRIWRIARSMEVPALARTVLDWFEETRGYGTVFPGISTYRVLACADIALWIPIAKAAVHRLSPKGDRYLNDEEELADEVTAQVT